MYVNNLYILVHMYSTGVKIFGHSHIWIFSEQVFIDSFVLCTSHINLRVLVLWGCILDVGYVCCGFC